MKIDKESWEEHFQPSKREQRLERKIYSTKDRSKYKKTDQAKIEQKKLKQQQEIQQLSQASGEAKKGIVTLIRSQEFQLLIGGTLQVGRLKGSLKLEQDRQKNLIIVGDEVLAYEQNDGTFLVETILPRRSILCRQDNLNRIKRHLIASNIDQVLITLSIVNPHLRPTIIDRYIIAASKGGMKPILLINKIDLIDELTEDESEILKLVLHTYPQLGIPTLAISADKGIGLDELKEIMKDKVSVFSGQSGTGKSSLINATTGLSLRTRQTVDKTRKGAHTTTFAQLLTLPQGGMCVDTPGIKSFGIWDLDREDIRKGFPEICEVGKNCHFYDCWHQGEKGCAVQEEVESEESKISPLRYQSYLSLLFEIDEERKRR